ncbi:MAG: glycoside hydrolase family 25 protein [Corynebacterium sp.]|uniref:glycoside hydrolase family 25 protein n=2 Tax=Corynebacteriaceae TaxID=1653 RepID=UPI000B102A2E|nr:MULTISPECIES: glycoside hydrolase family 25 protein [Corynebacterium]MCG7446807.1 glycoside hydrolase family 25 protein [Corynebacterium aurimucosum]MCZ9300358.1 glycoside hydrolase family 25 protein [Corynebacterium marquesiae]MDK8479756.1 glycoside hydrolase family 25 protein [Corynebacterium marquesiae]MDU1462120.1 glycoside hydrolase family 25 protein [Corynebacterium sp.]
MTSKKALRKSITAVVTVAALAVSGTAVAQAVSLGAPKGIDVAAHQHPGGTPIDWSKVRTDGQSFAFVKATEGGDWVNPHYVEDIQAANAAGLKTGAYHYARPAGDAKTQAANFAAQIALAPDQTLPPALDIEVAEGKSAAQLEQWIEEFTSELKRLTGRTPMIYTYKYFWMGQMNNSQKFSDMPLWLAAYQDQAPEAVGGWNELSFWQRSGSGKVAGISTDVDMNLFNGSKQQLQSFSDGNYVDVGGALEQLVVSDGLDLSSDSTPLIGAILALAAGLIAIPQLADAAEKSGLDPQAAEGLAGFVKTLQDKDALPVEDLGDMAKGNFSVSDLAILLDNAGHVNNVKSGNVSESEVSEAKNAAKNAGADVPDFDAGKVATLLNRVLQ